MNKKTKIEKIKKELEVPKPEPVEELIVSTDSIKTLNGNQKRDLKKKLIEQRLNEYTKPIKIDNKATFTPDKKDIKKYHAELKKYNLTQLIRSGQFLNAPFELELMDRLKSRNKKEHAVVTIYNDNKTTDTGVIQCYDRTFERNGMCYMVMSERGWFDPEFGMTHFYYYANHVCPIEYQKPPLPDNAYDSKLIGATVKMKVIEALASVDIEKYVKILLILVVIIFILLGIDTITLSKIAKTCGAV